MATLVLTEAEKAAELWSDLDDAALGAMLRKKIASLRTAASQMDRTLTMAAALVLCADAAAGESAKLTLALEGVTVEGKDFGDWEVCATQMRKCDGKA